MHSLEQHEELEVQGCTSPRHGVASAGLGAAATKEVAMATATKRADLKNCIVESGRKEVD